MRTPHSYFQKHRYFFAKPPLFREKTAVFLCELRKVKCT